MTTGTLQALATRVYVPDNILGGYYFRLTPSQARIMATFDEHCDMTDYQLGYAYRLTNGILDQSWSGLRTRRSELVDMGAIVQKGVAKNENGRTVKVWGLASGTFLQF